MKNMTLSLFAVLAAACSDGDGASVNPVSGIWLFVAGDIFDDSCGYPDPPTSADGYFQLTNNGDGTLTINKGGEEPFECTLSGANFNCPQRFEDDIDAAPLDAVFHIRVSAEGSFQSNTSASGHQTVHVTCDGNDCALAAAAAGITVPCSYSESFTASHSG